MASTEEESSSGSLFEGMVLFSPSDLSSSPPLPQTNNSSPPPPPPPPVSPPTSQQPLDEDLFSDLTLQTQTQTPSESDETAPTTTTTTPPPSLARHPSSRKKRRAVRIGYARESLPDPDPKPPLQSPALTLVKDEEEASPPSSQNHADSSPQETLTLVVEDHGSSPQETLAKDETLPPAALEEQPPSTSTALPPLPPPSNEDGDDEQFEDMLELVRARISGNIDGIRKKAGLLSAKRKELGRRRRKAMEKVNSAVEEHKELERELEEAVEAEDFERAERVSESVAEKEKEKDGLVGELRKTEIEYDEVDSEMQGVLDYLIAAEEEGATLLEEFGKDATDYADFVLKKAEKLYSKQLEAWESSMESLEVNKIEIDIESNIISDARSGLESSIEHLVEDDRKEVEILRSKHCILSKELDALLALVRLKETEIAETDSQIHEVEKKISNVTSDFHGTQSSIDEKQVNLKSSISKLESETAALSVRKKEINEFICQAQEKRSNLRKLAAVSLDEARTWQDLVVLRKSLASSILKSREDKVKFANTEETILEEIQTLRQQTSAARTSLQELSATRVSIQQEIASLNQRIDFIDKRGPELEGEKKVAAAARNFKEAGRIAAEAKALHVEKESLQSKKEKAVFDLEKLEEEIKDTVGKIQECETLISVKEKEAAMAGCKRLWLVATSARAERSAALQMGDAEEADSLLKEAEAAESKARELEKTYDLETKEHVKTAENSVSVSLITNLEGHRLAEMVSAFNLPTSNGS